MSTFPHTSLDRTPQATPPTPHPRQSARAVALSSAIAVAAGALLAVGTTAPASATSAQLPDWITPTCEDDWSRDIPIVCSFTTTRNLTFSTADLHADPFSSVTITARGGNGGSSADGTAGGSGATVTTMYSPTSMQAGVRGATFLVDLGGDGKNGTSTRDIGSLGMEDSYGGDGGHGGGPGGSGAGGQGGAGYASMSLEARYGAVAAVARPVST